MAEDDSSMMMMLLLLMMLPQLLGGFGRSNQQQLPSIYNIYIQQESDEDVPLIKPPEYEEWLVYTDPGRAGYMESLKW